MSRNVKELEEKIARKMEKLKEKQNRKKEKKAGNGKVFGRYFRRD